MAEADPPATRFRYDEELLSLIREPAARSYLARQGLPHSDGLFFPVEARTLSAEGRDFLVIGHDGVDGLYCVDLASGEVVITSVDAEDGIGHVNASPEAFDRCVAEVDRGFPFGDAGSSQEELESISADLGRTLFAIDGSVFDEDPGFWYNLLHDVAIGDYAQE